MNEWISVNDRLPDCDEFVLVWSKKWGHDIDAIPSPYNKTSTKKEMAEQFLKYATHWQKLTIPPPDKEEG